MITRNHPLYMEYLDDIGVGYIKSGVNCLLSCPFHEDSNPSLSVNAYGGQWICFSCGKYGRFALLYAGLTGEELSVVEATLYDDKEITHMERVANEVEDLINEESSNPDVYLHDSTFYSKFPELSGSCRKYLHSRGISDRLGCRFNIRNGVGKEKDRIVLPIRDQNGYIRTYSARDITGNMKPKLRRPPNLRVHDVLYGLYEIEKWVWKDVEWEMYGARWLVLVEGEFDAIYLQEHGIPAVSLLGSMMDDSQKNILIRECKEVYLSLDGDDAGRRASNRIKEQLRGELFVSDIKLPDNTDPNSIHPESLVEFYPMEVFNNG